MTVTLYTTHCPQCKVIETKLAKAGITYEECSDINIMTQKGFVSVPVLEVDGQVMNFMQANQWLKEALSK
jgi:glutaredoxin